MRGVYTPLRASRPIRYLFTGAISYVIELAILVVLANSLLLSPKLAVAYSFWVGLAASFLLQKYITFINKESDRKTLGRQTLLYGLLVLLNYFFTIVFVDAFTDMLGLIEARTIALIITVCWNYFAYKRIFKQSKES